MRATLIGGYRILLHNGPTGGSLDDVAPEKTLISDSLLWIKLAESRGLARSDFEHVPAKFTRLD